MRLSHHLSRACIGCALLLLPASHAIGQAAPTAMRRRALTVFGLGNGTWTDVTAGQTNSYANGGKNLAITAGADLGLAAFNRYSLAAELRGTYPVRGGRIDAQKSINIGARISREPLGSMGIGGRLRPYADILVGRGAMTYPDPGYQVGTFVYKQTASWIFGGGAGAEFDVVGPFSAKAEVQIQHWRTPVVTSNSALPIQLGVGVAYRFGAGAGPR